MTGGAALCGIAAGGKAGQEKQASYSTPLPYAGGSYRDVFEPGYKNIYDAHHMPAKSVNGIQDDDRGSHGPAIRMDTADHKRTTSFRGSNSARKYRAKQKELVDSGRFVEALQMDIDDVKSKFPGKYDSAIAEILEYVEKIRSEGMIK